MLFELRRIIDHHLHLKLGKTETEPENLDLSSGGPRTNSDKKTLPESVLLDLGLSRSWTEFLDPPPPSIGESMILLTVDASLAPSSASTTPLLLYSLSPNPWDSISTYFSSPWTIFTPLISMTPSSISITPPNLPRSSSNSL